jgi:hypothetical protein
MKVELRKLADLRPYEQNPRLNADAVAAVARSIKEFGFRQPIVVDVEGVIICGHTRFKAAESLGLLKVPVHVARDLSAAQIKAYRIADNQTATLAEWDPALLPIELADLRGAALPGKTAISGAPIKAGNGESAGEESLSMSEERLPGPQESQAEAAMEFDLGALGFGDDELARLLSGSLAGGLVDPQVGDLDAVFVGSDPQAIIHQGARRCDRFDFNPEGQLVRVHGCPFVGSLKKRGPPPRAARTWPGGRGRSSVGKCESSAFGSAEPGRLALRAHLALDGARQRGVRRLPGRAFPQALSRHGLDQLPRREGLASCLAQDSGRGVDHAQTIGGLRGLLGGFPLPCAHSCFSFGGCGLRHPASTQLPMRVSHIKVY